MPKKKSGNKWYHVDIQFTTEFTYKVKAMSPAAAVADALKMYESGDDLHCHSEVFDCQIANVEQIK